MQRFFDIIFVGLAIIFLSPLLIPIMLILRFSGEGEIFFGQQRVGKDAKSFMLLKFATMLKDSQHMGTGTVTIKNDPRVLPVGHFLRKTKINELPQLLNILKGDMSIIGPRPQTQRCFDAFPEDAQQDIIKVRPGLSGVGSIVFRGEEEMVDNAGDADRFYDQVIMPYKGKLEQWYVCNQTLRHYFLLILLTVWVVIFPDSRLFWKVFTDIPQPPPALSSYV
jgi:lipopolysaccharide/colanic/teichoic acid biosynthesis glycosyltransferase